MSPPCFPFGTDHNPSCCCLVLSSFTETRQKLAVNNKSTIVFQWSNRAVYSQTHNEEKFWDEDKELWGLWRRWERCGCVFSLAAQMFGITNMQLFQTNLVNKACNILELWTYISQNCQISLHPNGSILGELVNVSVLYCRHSVLNYYAITMKHSISSPYSFFDWVCGQ